MWYKNGKKHRKNGPAVMVCHEDFSEVKFPFSSDFPDSIKEMWFFEGKLYREKGPAVTTYRGTTGINRGGNFLKRHYTGKYKTLRGDSQKSHFWLD